MKEDAFKEIIITNPTPSCTSIIIYN